MTKERLSAQGNLKLTHYQEYTLDMFSGREFQSVAPFHTQLLKWIGNKQRFAHEIASYFPTE